MKEGEGSEEGNPRGSALIIGGTREGESRGAILLLCARWIARSTTTSRLNGIGNKITINVPPISLPNFRSIRSKGTTIILGSKDSRSIRAVLLIDSIPRNFNRARIREFQRWLGTKYVVIKRGGLVSPFFLLQVMTAARRGGWGRGGEEVARLVKIGAGNGRSGQR